MKEGRKESRKERRKKGKKEGRKGGKNKNKPKLIWFCFTTIYCAIEVRMMMVSFDSSPFLILKS